MKRQENEKRIASPVSCGHNNGKQNNDGAVIKIILTAKNTKEYAKHTKANHWY